MASRKSRGSRHKSRSGSRKYHRSRSGSRHGSRKRGAAHEKVTRSRASRKPRKQKTRPLTEQSLAELQAIARSHGIPFGGLSRTQLIEKIIAYR